MERKHQWVCCRRAVLALAACGVLVNGALTHTTQAGVMTKVLQEGMEQAALRFSKEVAEEGVETVAKKMSSLASRHGDQVVAAMYQKIGPRAGKLVTEAGEHADDVARLLAKHGGGAIPLATRKTSLNLIRRYGDDAAEACLRHGTIAEPLVEQFGSQGAKMLTSVTTDQGARRLAILAKDGALRPDVCELVCRHGDRACEFLWKNRGVVLTTAAIALVASSPEEYFSGISQLTSAVVQPLADAAVKPVVTSVANTFPWVLPTLLVALISSIAIWIWRVPKLMKTVVLRALATGAGRIFSSK